MSLSVTGRMQTFPVFKELQDSDTHNIHSSNIKTETEIISHINIYEREEYQKLVSQFGEPKNRKQRRRYEKLAKKNIEKSRKGV